jgi:hypothetical protein
VPCHGKVELIHSVILEAACKFGVADVTKPSELDVRGPARTWAMGKLHRRGVPVAQIARALHTTVGVVQVAVGASAGELDPDDDELEVREFRGPTRMLPMAGNRRDCALASACLGELLRACAPASPHAASCPSTCVSFQPPPRPERAEFGAGLGAWNEADLPPDPERDNGPGRTASPWAAQQARAEGRFVRRA